MESKKTKKVDATTISSKDTGGLQGELQQYIRLKRIDTIIGSYIEEVMKNKPSEPISHLVEFIYSKYPIESKTAFETICQNYKISNQSDPAQEKNSHNHSGYSEKSSKEVKAELQEYLSSMKINSILNSMVEKLLQEKPAQPHSFAVIYLCETYPNRVRHALDKITPIVLLKSSAKSKDAKGINSSKIDYKNASSKLEIPTNIMGLSDTESENEEENKDDINQMPEIAPPKPRVINRRVSVSAESLDPAKLKDQMAQVANIYKSPQMMTLLRKIVGRSPMLKSLDIEQKELIVKAFSGPIEMKDEEDVIVQGDIGDTFFLLEEGSVDVYIKKKGTTDEVKVHTYKPGDAFGQLALMYNAPRAATCRVNGSAKLWALDRVSFKVIVVAAAMQKREKYKNFLSQVPILETLNEMEIMTLADSLAEETYEDGKNICKEGEEGDTFYIIKDGIALCFQADEDTKEELLVATLSRGQHFGEIALLTSKPRQATVRAKGVLKVLAIDRVTFTRVFGSMDEIMKRNKY